MSNDEKLESDNLEEEYEQLEEQLRKEPDKPMSKSGRSLINLQKILRQDEPKEKK